MLKFKTSKTIIANEKVLNIISSTKPNELKIVNGKIDIIEITNIKTIIPIKYYITYNDKIVVINEYPKEEIKGNNFYNLNTGKSVCEYELASVLKNTTCKL